jgi:hypothetical protein
MIRLLSSSGTYLSGIGMIEAPSVIALADIIVRACREVGVSLKPTDSYMLAEYVLTEMLYRQHTKTTKPTTYTDAEIEIMTKNGLWHE